MGLLQVIQPEINLIHQPLSYYVHGQHGWLLPLALATFGSSAVVLGWRSATAPVYLQAARWLTLFGGGMLVAALAPSDPWFPWEGPVSISGSIHAFVAVVAPPLLLGAMWSLRRMASASRVTQTSLNLLALSYLVGLVTSAASLVVGFFTDRAPPLIGLTERILALAAVGWLALAAGSASARPTMNGQ